MGDIFDYEKDISLIVRKYSDKTTKEAVEIIAKEAKEKFADCSTSELVEIYRETKHKWLVLPELNRRRGCRGQLSLFSY